MRDVHFCVSLVRTCLYVCNWTLASLHTRSNRNNRVDSNTFFGTVATFHTTFPAHLCYIIIIHLITLCILSAFSGVFSHSTYCTYIYLCTVHSYVLQRQDCLISSHCILHLPASDTAIGITVKLGD